MVDYLDSAWDWQLSQTNSKSTRSSYSRHQLHAVYRRNIPSIDLAVWRRPRWTNSIRLAHQSLVPVTHASHAQCSSMQVSRTSAVPPSTRFTSATTGARQEGEMEPWLLTRAAMASLTPSIPYTSISEIKYKYTVLARVLSIIISPALHIS